MLALALLAVVLAGNSSVAAADEAVPDIAGEVDVTAYRGDISGPVAPTVADNGVLWFGSARDGVVRIAPGGAPTVFTDSGGSSLRDIREMVATGDSSVWYSERRIGQNQVGRLSPDGTNQVVIDSATDFFIDLEPAPDDGLWLRTGPTLPQSTLVRIDGAGTVTTTDIAVTWLRAASDGAVWSAVEIDGVWNLRHVSAGLVVTDQPLPMETRPLPGLAADLDGGIWFTVRPVDDPNGQPSLGHANLDGVEFVDDESIVGPTSLAVSDEGDLWFYDVDPDDDNVWIVRIDSDGHVHRTAPLPYVWPNLTSSSSWTNLSNSLVPMADGTVWSWLHTNPYEVFSIDETMTLTPEISRAPTRSTGFATLDGTSLWITSGSSIVEVALDGERTVHGTISAPRSLTIGPDGALWWVNARSGAIGRLDSNGTPELVHVESADSLTTGPDGHLWFTDSINDRIGRLAVDGDTGYFTDPGISSPTAIVAAPDGRLWFANAGEATIGRVGVDGTFDFLSIDDLETPALLARGRHGDVWFSEHLDGGGSSIGRITADDEMQRQAHPFRVNALTLGANGDMWFSTTSRGQDAGWVEVDGTTNSLSVIQPMGSPRGIARGPGGNMWLTHTFMEEGMLSWVTRLDTEGANGFLRPRTPGTGGLPNLGAGEIIAGADNDLWMVSLYSSFGLARLEVSCGPAPFTDVNDSNPFCFDISWLSARGITQGFPDGTFRPAQSIERQAMAAFLWRAADEPQPDDAPPVFADVGPTNPFYDAIQWMGQQGISTGTPQPDGTALFEPVDPVSRQAMAAFIWRAADEPEPTDAPPVFADVSPANPFYDAIQWMGQQGISTGTPQPGSAPLYLPGDPVSRQAMAAFLNRTDQRNR
ncbi:MAG: S-layer homology domain-containing protein [Acidimicrobiia bacterium]|nr:S-layer homology domain-containing protein [Acidimicrobiia bacterium]